MVRLLALALAAPAATASDGEATARDILRKAIGAQGKLEAADVHDVTLMFKGEASENGEVHAITRTYRYRAKDRSFRVHTGAEAANRSTDRGVFGADGYWERSSKGTTVALSRGNRDDAATIRQIESERSDFERMLRMVLLTRLDEGWTVDFGAKGPLRLESDHPHELDHTLGDRGKVTYHVLDATRDGDARLRLFVNTEDFTVRKAIEYEAEAPDRVRWVYYFAAYARDSNLGLVLPRYFSLYRDTPSDKGTRDRLNAVKGEPKVSLNTGLADPELRPAS
jgi:hypothetical protein